MKKLYTNRFFQALNIQNDLQLKLFSKSSKVSVEKLKYYNEQGIFPFVKDLEGILKASGLTEFEFRIRMGIFNYGILDKLLKHSTEIMNIVNNEVPEKQPDSNHKFAFETEYGRLYQGDCLSLMDEMKQESVDLIFADPPFNLDKIYESGINDKMKDEEYLRWTESWVLKCIGLLKEGGSIFIWNLPKWNTYISEILNQYLSFKHWIAVDIKYRMPIKNRLYPSHYGLLYYTKGERANTFNEQRLPLEVCRHCGGDIRDYGGYKDKLNENGINLTDVWYDIPPVRHDKYKTRTSNELSIKLLERIISLASNEGDLVFDPFGGSGTTYIVSEILKRRWIGIEIGEVESIKRRFEDHEFHRKCIKDIQENKNVLFTRQTRRIRIKNGHWLPETLKSRPEDQGSLFFG